MQVAHRAGIKQVSLALEVVDLDDAVAEQPGFFEVWSFANYISKPKGQLILFKTGLLPYRGDITIKTVNVKR